jgi:hypothetical protein
MDTRAPTAALLCTVMVVLTICCLNKELKEGVGCCGESRALIVLCSFSSLHLRRFVFIRCVVASNLRRTERGKNEDVVWSVV